MAVIQEDKDGGLKPSWYGRGCESASGLELSAFWCSEIQNITHDLVFSRRAGLDCTANMMCQMRCSWGWTWFLAPSPDSRGWCDIKANLERYDLEAVKVRAIQ